MAPEGFPSYESTVAKQEHDEIRQAIGSIENSESVASQLNSGESSESHDSIDKKVQEFLEKFADLAEKKGIDGFDVFENFLEHAGDNIKQSFIDRTNMRNLKNVIDASGRFPVNEFEFQQSIIEGNILADTEVTKADTEVTKADTEVTKADTEVTKADTIAMESEHSNEENIYREKGKIILSIHRNIDLSIYSPEFLNYQELIDKSEKWTDEERSEVNKIQANIISALKQGRTLEQEILPQAYAQGPEVFESVSQSLVGLDEGFQARIDAWKMTPEFKALPVEQKIRTSRALGLDDSDRVAGSSEQSGNIFSIETEDGFDVDYDVVANTRTFSIDGYSVDANVEDRGDYQTPKLEYMRVEQEHLPQIKIIQAIGESLSEKQVGEEELAEIKATIAHIPGVETLGISFDSLTSGEAIKTALQTALVLHQDAINDARNDYKNALIFLGDGYKANREKKDILIKKLLRFVESIGFTIIPQYITDQVIDMLNSNASLRAQIGMNEEIDFSNGKLGIDTNPGEGNNIDIADMKAFAEIFNAMLGVKDSDGNPPVNVDAIGTSSPLSFSESQQGIGRMQMLIAQSGILVGGAGRIIENLRKLNKEK